MDNVPPPEVSHEELLDSIFRAQNTQPSYPPNPLSARASLKQPATHNASPALPLTDLRGHSESDDEEGLVEVDLLSRSSNTKYVHARKQTSSAPTHQFLDSLPSASTPNSDFNSSAIFDTSDTTGTADLLAIISQHEKAGGILANGTINSSSISFAAGLQHHQPSTTNNESYTPIINNDLDATPSDAYKTAMLSSVNRTIYTPAAPAPPQPSRRRLSTHTSSSKTLLNPDMDMAFEYMQREVSPDDAVFELDCEGRPKKHICDECPKGFSKRSDLERHRKKHTGERPYKCTVEGCGKGFIQQSALKVHSRVHTGEKPHVCEWPDCKSAFGDSSALARHRHQHSLVRKYTCPYPICNRSFVRRDGLANHMKKHSVPEGTEPLDINDFLPIGTGTGIRGGKGKKRKAQEAAEAAGTPSPKKKSKAVTDAPLPSNTNNISPLQNEPPTGVPSLVLYEPQPAPYKPPHSIFDPRLMYSTSKTPQPPMTKEQQQSRNLLMDLSNAASAVLAADSSGHSRVNGMDEMDEEDFRDSDVDD